MAGDSIERWAGREVVFRIDEDNYKAHGILQSASALGLVTRTNIRVSHGQPNRSGERESIDRVVSVFYPWHRVQEVRLAEPEEKQMDDEEQQLPTTKKLNP